MAAGNVGDKRWWESLEPEDGMASAVHVFAETAIADVPTDASRAVLESAEAWLAERGTEVEPALRALTLLRENINGIENRESNETELYEEMVSCIEGLL